MIIDGSGADMALRDDRIPYTTWMSKEAIEKVERLHRETGLRKQAILELAVMNVKIEVKARGKKIRVCRGTDLPELRG